MRYNIYYQKLIGNAMLTSSYKPETALRECLIPVPLHSMDVYCYSLITFINHLLTPFCRKSLAMMVVFVFISIRNRMGATKIKD